MPLKLSERQQAAVAAAVTILAAVVILCAVAGLFWLLGTFFRAFSNVFLPLAVAAVAALVFHPYYHWLRRRMPTAVALILVFLSILLPIAGFVWAFGALAAGQISDFLSQGAPQIWARVQAQLQAQWPQLLEFWQEHGQEIQAAVEAHQKDVFQGLQIFGVKAVDAGVWILGVGGALIPWAVLPVYFAFFMMTDSGKITDISHFLPFLKKETRDDVVYLVREFVNIVVAFFRGQLIVAFLQGVLFAVGFTAVGLRYGFVLGLALGFLNVIPYLGSIVGLGIAIPLAFFQPGGGVRTVVLVLVVFTVVQVIEGYILTPKVMGDRTGLHPMMIIVAVFFWGSALGGVLGMILAIPLTAFLVVFWRLAKEKYIKELV
jgi:predicted PurR-regulated permease PerM